MLYLKWMKINDFIEVSNFGDVKSHGRIVKGELTKNGYNRIHVSHKGKQYKFLVHRLVAEAFIPNPRKLPEVNHLDGNKLNNNVENLEWVTRGENTSHAFKIGLRNYFGNKNPNSKLTEHDIKEIKRLYTRGKHCENNSYGLANKFNVSAKTIMNVINGVHY